MGVFGDSQSRDRFMEVGPQRIANPTHEERDAAKTIINSDRFGRRFAEQLGYLEGDPAVKLLKSGAWLMVGGLFHFLDLQIKALMRRGLDVRDLETVRVCFAGRGSTLLKLLRDDRAFEKLIELPSVAESAGGEQGGGGSSVNWVFSEKPKHEAAQGMMAGEADRQTFDLQVQRVCGVVAKLGEQEIAADSIPEPAASGNARSSVQMDDFQAFLKKVGDRCGFAIELGREASTDIRRSGEVALDALLEKRPVDPPFIAMLQRTLRLLYHGGHVHVQWSDTQR